MMSKIKFQHKLSEIPTLYDETNNVIFKRNVDNLHEKIKLLETRRRQNDEKAILEVVNEKVIGIKPLVKLATIESDTFQQALSYFLSIRTTEAFDVMMILFEYIAKNNTNKIDKLTGTELLKFSNAKSITQEMRHRKLSLLVSQSAIKIHAIDPSKSIENYQNKQSNEGLVYKTFALITIKEITYSKTNTNMITKLRGIEILPGYFEYKHAISKRYIPLETIRKIPEGRGRNKLRHFVYKLCIKFSSIKKCTIILNLLECMNLGDFINKDDRNIKKKWKPIERALIHCKKVNLIDFEWIFVKNSTNNQIKYKADGSLYDEYYKYIRVVKIERLYVLDETKERYLDVENSTSQKK